jgi:predicted Rossmann-fold nucleotide-binding protein
MVDRYDTETRRVSLSIPPGPRLVVIGSGSFRGPDSRRLCEDIAVNLAAVAGLVVVTGGRDGVGRTFGRAFVAARQAAGQSADLFHLVPHGFRPCDSGVTLGAGVDYIERREVLGRIGQTYLVIEGGPGTEYEAAVATGRRMPIIPLARTGGHAGELYSRVSRPEGIRVEDWAILADAGAPLAYVVAAVGRVVRTTLASYAEP